MQYITTYASPLGGIVLTAGGAALTGLWFEGQKGCPLPTEYEDGADLPVLRQAVEWLDVYFSGRDPGFTPPLRPTGTPFQNEVWTILLTIPYGQTRMYGEIARELAQKRGIPRMSAQAVGGAVGRNAISIIVPCHRVVGSDGSLTGYAGGLARKFELLKLEGGFREEFFIPKHSTAP